MNTPFSRTDYQEQVYFDFDTQLPLCDYGDFLISSKGCKYPVVDGIPRFVDSSNYADDFGFQWCRFAATQLDSKSGLRISEDRLISALGGLYTTLPSSRVLEAGSGAGRFSEILIKNGAVVHSFDYSAAVNANQLNNPLSPKFSLAQADIRRMPYKRESYDLVICLGVLQHTPSPEESISKLWQMVRPGGSIVFDHYMFKWRIFLPPPFGQALDLYRPLVLRLPSRLRFKIVKRLVDFWFPLHWNARHSWFKTRLLRRISPVIFHFNYLRLPSRDAYYEWSLLDTHDSLTDHFKHYRTLRSLEDTVQSLPSCESCEIFQGDNGLVVRAKKA